MTVEITACWTRQFGIAPCPTCEMMGGYAGKAIRNGFPEQLQEGSVAFRLVDYENKENEALAKDDEIRGPALTVAKITDDKVEKHQNLEQIWTKVRDKPKFIE